MNYKNKLYKKYVSSHLRYRKKININKSLDINYVGYSQRFKKLIPKNLDSCICDLGCGRGDFVLWLNNLGYKNVAGVDISEEQIDQANELKVKNITHGDIFQYLQKHKNHDLIVARDLLEHLDRNQIYDFIETTFSSLNEGGRIILQVPNATSPYFGRVLYGDFTHELAFTGNSIRQLMHANGYRNVKIYPWRPVIHNFKSLLRYLAWRTVEFFIKLPIIIESSTDTIVTMNFIISAEK